MGTENLGSAKHQNSAVENAADQQIEKRLSSLAIILGILSVAVFFCIPLLIVGFDNAGSLIQVISIVPPIMMVTGIVIALKARTQEEPVGIVRVALVLNGLLLLAYVAIAVTLFTNPIAPT